MSYGTNQRISEVFFDFLNFQTRIRLKKLDKKELIRSTTFFRELFDHESSNFKTLYQKFIIVTKQLRTTVNSRTTNSTKKFLKKLMESPRFHSCQSRRTFHREAQVIVLDQSHGDLSSIKLLRSCFRNIVHETNKVIKLIENENRVLSELTVGKLTVKQIAQQLKVPEWKIYRLRNQIIVNNDFKDRKAKSLMTRVFLLKKVNLTLQQYGYRFDSAKELLASIQNLQNEPHLSRSSFYRTLKITGLRYRTAVKHPFETAAVKESRIWFFVYFTKFLSDPNTECFYFDWTSFAEGNFKKRCWALKGVRSVANKLYTYAGLHLLTIMSQQGIEAFQFVRGNLNSNLEFNFFSGAMINIRRKVALRIKRIVVVLDNSPLNNSNALINFVVDQKFNLLFTAPNSCFLNPIEMAYAYLKHPFKNMYSTNKFDN